MPYVITTRRYVGERNPSGRMVTSRRAVATLEEARKVAWVTANNAGLALSEAASETWLPEQGGTVGPLPDETVIEVERVTLNDLRIGTRTLDMSPAELVAAYNAAQT